MKKLLIFIILLAGITLPKAQYSINDEMQIMNYSRFIIGGHVSFQSDTCYPAFRGEFTDAIYPFPDALGRDVAYYKKYQNSASAAVPITQWLVATSLNSYLPLAPTSLVLSSPTSPLVTLTKWGGLEVEYLDPTSWPAVGGGFAVNYLTHIEVTGSPFNNCYTHPMTYSDANVDVISFYTGGTGNDYIVIIS